MKKLFVIFVVLIFLSVPLYAQDTVLAPTGTWMVGPMTLEVGTPEAAGMPCIMVNKFSNNIEMRFSGGGEDILAMALSVDEKPFIKDQSYLISIGFTAANAVKYPAQAFAENTLVIGLEPGKDFYKSLQMATSLFVTLGTETMEFSLQGVPQGLKLLENCFRPAVQAAAPAIEPESPGIRVLDKTTGNVLSPMELPVPKAALDSAVSPRDILPATNAVTGEQKRWRVMKGGELYGVLKIWADNAKAQVIWKADRAFIVPESVVMQGTFEEAIEGLLLQFPRGQSRPVAKIYNDPVTLQKTLLIENETIPAVPVGEGNYAPIDSR